MGSVLRRYQSKWSHLTDFGGRQNRFPTSRLTVGNTGGECSQSVLVERQANLPPAEGQESLSSRGGTGLLAVPSSLPLLCPGRPPEGPAKLPLRVTTDENKSALSIATLHLSSLGLQVRFCNPVTVIMVFLCI